MGFLWFVLVYTSIILQTANGLPIRNSEIYPHDGTSSFNSINWESTSLYAAIPAVALVIAAFSFILGCTWCYTHKDCKLFTASVSRIQDVARAPPPPPLEVSFAEPVNNNISEDNNNGPISFREMQNIANNNATAYIVSENEERNRAVSRESVVEFEPLPAALEVHINPLERCRDWFAEEDFPRQRLQYLREIGRGWFGRIVDGEVDNGDSRGTVAVKILNQNASLEDKARFLDECKLYRDLRHDHLLTYIGRCLNEEPWIVVFELCAMDLQQYLSLNRPKMAILNEGGVPLRIACDVTSALAYLHSRGYVYGVVWCGSVCVRGETEGARGVLGAYRPHPPPLAPPDPHYTSMSDVWTVGAFLWELCSWSPAPLAPLAEPALPCPYRTHLYQVMQLCWNCEPRLRPSAAQVHALVAHLESSHRGHRAHRHRDVSTVEEFERRWTSLKPNHIPVVDDLARRSHSLTTLRGSREDVSSVPPAPPVASWLRDLQEDVSYLRDVSDVINDLDNILNEENTSSEESSHQPSPARDHLRLDCGPPAPAAVSGLVKSPGITDFQNILVPVQGGQHVADDDDNDRDTIGTLSHSFGRRDDSQNTLANLTPDTPNRDDDIFNQLEPPHTKLDNKDSETSKEIFDKQSINDAEMPNEFKHNISYNECPKLRELCLASIPRLSENEQINISEDCQTSCDIEKETVTDTHECIITKSVDNVVFSQNHQDTVKDIEENKNRNEEKDYPIALYPKELIQPSQNVIESDTSQGQENHLVDNITSRYGSNTASHPVTETLREAPIINDTSPLAKPRAEVDCNIVKTKCDTELYKEDSVTVENSNVSNAEKNNQDSLMQLRQNCESFLNEIIAESVNIIENTQFDCSNTQSQEIKLCSQENNDANSESIGKEAVISFKVVNEVVIPANQELNKSNNHSYEHENDVKVENIIVQHEDGINFTESSPGKTRYEELKEKSASESLNDSETPSTVPIDSKPEIVQKKLEILESSEEPKNRSDNTTNESTVYMDLINNTNTLNISKGNIIDDNIKNTIKTCVEKNQNQNSFIQVEFNNESTVYLDLPNVIEDSNQLLNSERGTTNFEYDVSNVTTSTPKVCESIDSNNEKPAVSNTSENICIKEFRNDTDNVSPLDSPTKSHPTDTYDENSSVLLGPFETNDHYKPIMSEESSFPKEEVLAFSSNFSEMNLATPSPLHDVNFLNEVPDLDSVTEFNFNDLKDTDVNDDHYIEIVDITDLDKPHVSPSTPPNSPGNFLAPTSSKYLVDDVFVPDSQDAVDINQIDLQMTTKLAMAENENNMNIEYSGPLTIESIRENYVIPDIIIAGNGILDNEDEPRVEFTLDDESMKAIRDELESKLPLAQISSIEPDEEAAGPMEVVLNYCGALSPIFEETAGQLERYENDIVSQPANTSKVFNTYSSESYFEPCDNSTDDITDLLTAANQTFTISSGDVPANVTYSVDNKDTHKNATVNKASDGQSGVQLVKISDRPSTSKAQDNLTVESAHTPVDESTYNLMEKLSDCDRLSQVSPCLISPTTEKSIPNSDNATTFSTLCNTTIATDAKAETTKHDSTQLSKGTSIDSWCSNDTLFNVEDTFDDLAADDECKDQEPDESSKTLTDHEDDKDDSHCTPYIANDKSDDCDSMSSDSPTGHGTYTKLKADEATTTASTPSEPNDSLKTTQTKDLAYGTLMSGVSCSNCTTEVMSSLDWNLPQPELVRKSPCLDDTYNITQINLFDTTNDVSESPIISVEKNLNRIESVDQTFFIDNPTDSTCTVDTQEKQAKNEKSPDYHLMNMAKSIQSTPLLHVVTDNDDEPIPFIMPSNELNKVVDQSTNFNSFVNSAELRPQDIESLTTNKEFGQSINTDSLFEAIDSRVNHSVRDSSTAISPTYADFKTLAVNQPQDITLRSNGRTEDEYAAFEQSIQNRPQNESDIQDNIAILSNVSESNYEQIQVLNFTEQRPHNLESSTSNKESGLSTNSDLLLEAEGSSNYYNTGRLTALSPIHESFESCQNASSSKSNEVIESRLEEFIDFQNSIVNRPQDVSNINECQLSTNTLGNSSEVKTKTGSIEPKDEESSIIKQDMNLSTNLDMVPQTSNTSSNNDTLIVYDDFRISAVSQPQDFSGIADVESSKSREHDCNRRQSITNPNVESLSDDHICIDADHSHVSYLPFTGANVFLAGNNIYDTEDAYDQPHSIIITEDVENTFNSHENTNISFISYSTPVCENKLQSPKEDIKIDDFTITQPKNCNDNCKVTDELTNDSGVSDVKKGSTNSQEQDQKEKQATLIIQGKSEEFPMSVNTELSNGSNHTSIKENGIVNDTGLQLTSHSIQSGVTQNGDTSIGRHVSALTENFLKNEQQFNEMCLRPPMLNDIRFMGPGPEMLSTSFTDDSPTEETPKEKAVTQNEHENQNGVVADIIREWDSGSDGSNSSSGEFIWKGGDGLQMILTSSPYYQHNRSEGGDGGGEERGGGGDEDDGEGEEGDEVEFVPSSWDCRAEPSKSALRTLARQHSQDKKRVVFKREKYHCVYEYPREVAVECDATSAANHYTTYADWDAASAEEAELAYGQLYGDHPLDLYSLRSGVYDYDDDFFISSSARPFESVGVMSSASQFFPGMKSTLELTTPDSGVEDVLTPPEPPSPPSPPEPPPWGADSCSSSESVSPASELGGLRHTRDRLKLDLPASPLLPTPSPRSPRHARIFNFDQHTFSTFGKVPPPTPPTVRGSQDEREETQDIVKEEEEQPATSAEVKIQEIKGEGTVLDSGDEDSGIESSSKASLDRNKQSPNLSDHTTEM